MVRKVIPEDFAKSILDLWPDEHISSCALNALRVLANFCSFENDEKEILNNTAEYLKKTIEDRYSR